MVEHEGGCHCGALSLRYAATEPVDAWSVRSCTCSFCHIHSPRYTSDPQGALTLVVRDAAALRTYRFGTKTADFILCGHCGSFLCAVSESTAGPVAVLNMNCLQGMPPILASMVITLDGESVEERLERRGRRWTPFTSEASRLTPEAPSTIDEA